MPDSDEAKEDADKDCKREKTADVKVVGDSDSDEPDECTSPYQLAKLGADVRASRHVTVMAGGEGKRILTRLPGEEPQEKRVCQGEDRTYPRCRVLL